MPWLILLCLASALRLSAADWHVDPRVGDDDGDGRSAPLRTLARAIRLAGPGDTIHLRPDVVYYDSAVFANRHGEPGRPITLDGHGAVIDGSEPVRAADWEALGGGLFRKGDLVPKISDATLGRWFFLWDGRMNRMGRTSKGPKAAFKAPQELQPGEWTHADGAFYLRLADGADLDAANIRYPARANAVAQAGTGSHLVIRNVTGRHVWNDGFNVHGAQRALVFENIAAIECGDDGFSAHEDAECRIDGFTSIGNSTGLCDIGSSVTRYRNVHIRDCHGYDIFFLGDSPHSMENVVVESTAVRALQIARHGDRPQNGEAEVVLKNVLIRRGAPVPGLAHVGEGARLTLEGCTLEGLDFTVATGGEAELRRCVLGGGARMEIREGAVWRGADNRYALTELVLGLRRFGAAEFVAFQHAVQSEAGSAWGGAAGAPAGADPSWLSGP